jgi:hypothetical protein
MVEPMIMGFAGYGSIPRKQQKISITQDSITG